MKKLLLFLTIGIITIQSSCTNGSSQQKDTNTVPVETNTQQSERPKNIILMIGDGMGLTQITAGLIAKRDVLNLQRCTIVGLIKTNSSDNLITDSAAGATAFSTGVKTYNGAIGVDPDRVALPTILEIAEKNGLATGMVATSSITHATPASFISHQPSRLMDEEIAADFLKTDIDVFIGGGQQFFETRSDGIDLLDSLRANNYQVVSGIDEITEITEGKLAGFLADVHPNPFSEGRADALTKSSLTAINILSQNEKGFFLMIEGSQIDWGGHANQSEYIISEMVDFDDAVGEVLDFAEKDGNTLVIITADHETGGYAINGGNLESGSVEGAFTTDYHTATMVPVFAYGPGAENFSGIYHNTIIFNKMMSSLGLEK